MFPWFGSLAIKWKLTLIAVTTTAVALAIACAITVILEMRTYQSQKVAELTAQANILAGNVVGAAVFGDADAATNAVTSLSANAEIELGAAYDADGKLLGKFTKTAAGRVPETAPRIASEVHEGLVTIAVPVLQQGASVGTVYVGARIETGGTRMTRQAAILLIVGLASLGLALPAAMRLNRAVIDPVEEIEAKNAIIETTLANVDHGILVVDKNLRVTFVNDRITRLHGPSAPALAIGDDIVANTKISQAARSASAEASAAEDARLTSGDSFRGEYKTSTNTTVEYRQVAIPGGGFVRTYTDVTDERTVKQSLEEAKARAEDADRAKSAFLAAMSHEIRTPMNGVIGVVELLSATPLSPDQQQMVDIIHQSGSSLLHVINDILDYSKIEAGRMTIEAAPFVLGDLIETTAKSISGHTKSKTLNVICSVDPEIDWSVVGDSVRVRQILLNLMGNALKFTEIGSIELTAKLASQSDDGIEVLFEVRDTGIGIASDKIDRLFERFTQADYSTTRRFGGTGLGLSISKHLVGLMGGEIGVNSTPGQGSTFWFRVPFDRIAAADRADPFAPFNSSLKGVRVIVCDRIASQSAISAYLNAAGVEITEASSVGQIVERYYESEAKNAPAHVIVLKVRLGEDSIALLSSELERRKALQNVKVLLVLPNMSASAAKPLTAPNVSSSIYSPISRHDLYAAISELMGRQVAAAAGPTRELDFMAPAVEEAAEGGGLVLVAEDNETNQFVIKTQLRRLGIAAEFAGDGQEAWNLLKRNPDRYGLLLTDCHMPFVDGYQLARLVRESEGSGERHLPIVALTANALEGEADLCRAAGMDDYLSKPVLLSALNERIVRWLPQTAKLRRPAGAATPAAPESTPVIVPIRTAQAGAPIDLGKLANLIGNDDPAYLKEMLSVFWETMADTPGVLRAHTRSRDSKNLILAAHAAKGAAASACADSLAELCRRLETAAKAEKWDEIDGLSSEIWTAFDEIEDFVAATVDSEPEKQIHQT